MLCSKIEFMRRPIRPLVPRLNSDILIKASTAEMILELNRSCLGVAIAVSALVYFGVCVKSSTYLYIGFVLKLRAQALSSTSHWAPTPLTKIYV